MRPWHAYLGNPLLLLLLVVILLLLPLHQWARLNLSLLCHPLLPQLEHTLDLELDLALELLPALPATNLRTSQWAEEAAQPASHLQDWGAPEGMALPKGPK